MPDVLTLTLIARAAPCSERRSAVNFRISAAAREIPRSPISILILAPLKLRAVANNCFSAALILFMFAVDSSLITRVADSTNEAILLSYSIHPGRDNFGVEVTGFTGCGPRAGRTRFAAGLAGAGAVPSERGSCC